MNVRRILHNIFIAILLAAGHLTVASQEVTVTVSEAPVLHGSTIKGTLLLSIPEGLHVNSSKPSSEYLIATSVKLSGAGIRLSKIDYPEGENRKFQFSEGELNVYEGDISIPFSVTVLKTSKRKQISMTALVRYQACTEEVCYPPRNKEITMTTYVK